MGRGGEADKRVVVGVCCGCLGFWLILILWLSSLGIVPYTKVGLRYHIVSKDIERTVYEPGRHAIGLGYAFHLFPRNVEQISFTWPYDSGESAPSDTGKVVRITARDSATVDLACTMTYSLDQATLLDLYNTFAFNWKASFTNNARSVLRDKAATYDALDFVTEGQRIEIEKELRKTMADFLKTKKDANGKFTGGGATLVSFNLLEISFANINRNKDQEILNIVKGDIDRKKIQENEKLDLIKEVTKTNVSKLSAKRIADLNILAQINDNLKKDVETQIISTKATTDKLVQDISSQATANATNYRAETTNLRITKERSIREYDAETKKLTNAIYSSTKLLDAANQEQVTLIAAEASAKSIQITRETDAEVLSIKAAAIEESLRDILAADSLNRFTPDDLNRLLFVESISEHNKKKLKVDLQVPESLKLDGQKEIQTANLT
eukprot:g4675.t1